MLCLMLRIVIPLIPKMLRMFLLPHTLHLPLPQKIHLPMILHQSQKHIPHLTLKDTITKLVLVQLQQQTHLLLQHLVCYVRMRLGKMVI